MSAAYVWLAEAWDWITGLRISTRRQRESQQAILLGAERAAHHADLQKKRAEADKREAQRVLTILSEPLKDWDLNDFPDWTYAGNPPTQPVWLNSEDARHAWALVQAWRAVARDAAQARMSVTFNDRARQRGWGDQPIRPTPSGQRRDPRRLP